MTEALTTAGDPVIDATGVSRIYGEGVGAVTALYPTDFRVGSGEFLLINGPSGSGKSTLLTIISGLLRPSAGEVRILGEDIARLSTRAFDDFRLAHLGFVFQGFNLLPALTAVEQVSILIERGGTRRAEARERARIVLSEVGLSHRLQSRPSEMSGGEKQRVAVARALAKRPRIVFADEPTSALDSTNGAQVAGLLQQASARQGATIICVTHDARLKRFASRLVSLEDGAVVSAG